MAPLANQLVIGGDSCNDGFSGCRPCSTPTRRYSTASAATRWRRSRPTPGRATTSRSRATWSTSSTRTCCGPRPRASACSSRAGDDSGVETPSSDPYATSVGGTTLGIGRKDPRLFETGWSNRPLVRRQQQVELPGRGVRLGGGPSLLWAQPAYQRGVVPNFLAKAPGNRGGWSAPCPTSARTPTRRPGWPSGC